MAVVVRRVIVLGAVIRSQPGFPVSGETAFDLVKSIGGWALKKGNIVLHITTRAIPIVPGAKLSTRDPRSGAAGIIEVKNVENVL